VSTWVPSEENATEYTKPACPVKVRMTAPVDAFHSFAVASEDPVSTLVPSGLNATEFTAYACPVKMSEVAPAVAVASNSAVAVIPIMTLPVHIFDITYHLS
jgi:hypothetical protein